MADEGKSYNLDKRRYAIEQVWREMFPPPPPPMPAPEPAMVASGPWIIDYYDDYVVVYDQEKYYRVNYTASDEKVTLAPRSEWKEAVQKTEWVEAVKTLKSIARSPIKAVADWTLDVLAVPFGGQNNGKDSDGEYFSQNTNLYLDTFKSPLIVYYHGYEPDGRPSGEPVIIGKAEEGSWRKESDGWHIRVILDRASSYARKIWDAAKRGLARASSGSIAHLRRVAKDGEILHWPVAEVSLIDAEGRRQPANQYAVAMPVMKAVYDRAGIALPELPDETGEPEADATGTGVQSADAGTAGKSVTPFSGESEMEPKDVEQIVADALKADREAREAAEKRQAEEKRFADLEAENARLKEEAAKGRRLPDGAPYIKQFSNLDKFDNLDAADTAFLIGILNRKTGDLPEQPRASEDAVKALAIKLIESDEPEDAAAKSAMKAAGFPMDAAKANELNQSTLASYGDEWVGVEYSRRLWEKIRVDTPVVGNLPTVEVPQGVESITIPLEGTAPTFYKVAQASAQASNTLGAVTNTITTSKLGTGSQSLTVGKLGAAVIWAGEVDEDSLIPWVPSLRNSLTMEAQEVLEALMIDGDTATENVTNINDIGGQPAGTESFMVLNGFRKLALVTNTANSRSALGSFVATDFLDTVKLMGLAGKNAFRKQGVAFIVDPHTHWKALTLPEVASRDVFAQPTIESGSLTSIYGYPVITTYNMHRANQDATYGLKANSAGKTDLDTAQNNLYGAILAVRWDQWMMGWKRRISFESIRVPRADATELTVTMRVGLVNRDNEASATTYYVGV